MEDSNNYPTTQPSNSGVALATVALLCAIASVAGVLFMYMQIQELSTELSMMQEAVPEQVQVVAGQQQPQTVPNLGPDFAELGVGAPPAASDQAAYSQWAREYGEALAAYNERNGILPPIVEELDTLADDPEEQARIQQDFEADVVQEASLE